MRSANLYQRALPRVLLLVIVVAGAWLRLHQIGVAPPGLYRDEAFYGLDALNVLRGQFALFFAANNGREGLFIYLLSLGIAVLGRTPEALRIVSACIGIATILAIYAAGRQMFSQRIGLLAAGILAATFWHVAISRVAFRAITLPLMLCLTVACFFASLRSQHLQNQRWWSILAGVCFGLVFYTYTSGQFILILAAVFLLWQLVLRRMRPVRAMPLAGLRWVLLGAAITLAPFALWLLRHYDLYFARAGQVSILSPIINHGDAFGTLIGNIAKAALMFTHTGDRIWRHNLALRPVFDSLLALAFVIGVATCAWAVVRQWRTENEALSKSIQTRGEVSQCFILNSQFFLLLWLLVFLIPTILAEDTPHFLRAIGALPAACLVVALGLEAGLAWLSRRGWLMVTGILSRRISPPALIAALLIGYSGYRTYDDYFRVYVNEPMTGYWLEQQNVALANTMNEWSGTLWLQDQLIQDNAALRFLSPRVEQGTVNRFHLEGDSVQLQASGPISGLVILDPNRPWGALRAQLPIAPLRFRISEGALARGDLDPGPRRAFITLAISTQDMTNTVPLQHFEPNVVLQSAIWDRAPIGNRYDLALSWQLAAPVSEDYAVFVHWLRGGQLIAQSDHSAALGYWPMPEWRFGLGLTRGDVFEDHHVLAVPGGAQNGDEIRVGLYRRSDGVRLRATESAGDWVIIPSPR